MNNTEISNESTETETTEVVETGKKTRASKDSKTTYGAVGKTNLLLFNPEDLVLVTDKSSPLYDERVDLPVDENLVRNLMHYGQIQPIRVRKNPETGKTEVEVGRQRTKAMIEANRRLVERGDLPMKISAITQHGNEVTRAGIAASENAIRQDETPLTKAHKMARLISFGQTEEDLGVTFGLSKQQVKNYLALLDCTAVVKNAIEAGKVTITLAASLSKLDPAKQRESVENLIKAQGSAGPKKHNQAKATREAAQANGVTVARKVRGVKEINEFRARIDEKCDPEFKVFVCHVLDWVAGGREPQIPKSKKNTKVA